MLPSYELNSWVSNPSPHPPEARVLATLTVPHGALHSCEKSYGNAMARLRETAAGYKAERLEAVAISGANSYIKMTA